MPVGSLSYSGVLVFQGSVDPIRSNPPLFLTSSDVDVTIGGSVACDCDVNSDGYDDLIVGAAEGVSTGQLTTATHVYLGGASGPDPLDPILPTPPISVAPGWLDTVACAGDANGDGYDDILVGSTLAGPSGDRGRVFVHLGGATGVRSRAFTLRSPNPTSSIDPFGVPFRVGDLNNDGFDDVAATTVNGKATLFFGQEVGSGPPDFEAIEFFDWSYILPVDDLDAAGDLNGDGVGDLLVSNAWAWQTTYNSGLARGDVWLELRTLHRRRSHARGAEFLPLARTPGRRHRRRQRRRIHRCRRLRARGLCRMVR